MLCAPFARLAFFPDSAICVVGLGVVSTGALLRKLSSRGVEFLAVVADLLDQRLSLVFRDAVLSHEVLDLVAPPATRSRSAAPRFDLSSTIVLLRVES